jgi:hypothetical protein
VLLGQALALALQLLERLPGRVAGPARVLDAMTEG